MDATKSSGRTSGIPEPEEFTGANGAQPHATSWPDLVEVNEFLARAIPPPTSIVEGLLDAGTRILFGGASKTFKTWMQVDLGICIAAGIPWLGFACAVQPVVFVNFEVSDYFIQKRIASIKESRQAYIPTGNFHLWNLRDVEEFGRLDFVGKLTEQCRNLKSNIAFIDPFYCLLADLEDENKQADMRKVLRDFRPLTKAGVTTAFGIHFSKGNQAAKEPEDRIGGAGTIVRLVDVVITLTRHQQPGCFTMQFNLRDRPQIEPFVVEWQHPVMVRRPDLDPKDLKTTKSPKDLQFDIEEIFEFAVLHDDQFKRPEFIAHFRQENRNWKERTAYVKLGALLKNKRLFISKVSKNINVSAVKP